MQAIEHHCMRPVREPRDSLCLIHLGYLSRGVVVSTFVLFSVGRDAVVLNVQNYLYA